MYASSLAASRARSVFWTPGYQFSPCGTLISSFGRGNTHAFQHARPHLSDRLSAGSASRGNIIIVLELDIRVRRARALRICFGAPLKSAYRVAIAMCPPTCLRFYVRFAGHGNGCVALTLNSGSASTFSLGTAYLRTLLDQKSCL